MSTIIDSIERSQLRQGIPGFGAGDRVKVHFQVIEGNRRRTQVFEGVVLKRQGSGARETFTVRKQSFGVGVERTFPLHSPKIEKLEIAGRGDVRRAKLYYLRGRVGKAARVAERRWGIDEQLLAEPAAAEGEALDSEGMAQSEAEVAEVPQEEEPEAEEAAAEEAPPEEAPAEEPGAEGDEASPEAEADQEPQAEEAAEEGQAAEEPADEQGDSREGDD